MMPIHLITAIVIFTPIQNSLPSHTAFCPYRLQNLLDVRSLSSLDTYIYRVAERIPDRFQGIYRTQRRITAGSEHWSHGFALQGKGVSGQVLIVSGRQVWQSELNVRLSDHGMMKFD